MASNSHKFVLVFLDDVLIYSASPQECVVHIRKLLKMLHKHQAFTKANKCEILKISVEFLGQKICSGGMSLTEAELKAVRG